MTDEFDEFEQLRQLRPDRLQPDDPGDPSVLARQKEQLMSVIDDTQPAPTALQMPAIYPRLAYSDPYAALDYLVRVFGFTEARESRMENDDGTMLAWLRFGDGIVMIGKANHDIHRIYSPREVGQSTSIVHVGVHDIDAHYERAVAEGADVTMPLADAFYGHRRYEVTDLDGHRWHFWEPLEEIRARGGQAGDVPEED